MRTNRKYRWLLTLLFFLSLNVLYSKNRIILSKGRIEFLVFEAEKNYLNSHTDFRDSMFSCANNALSELESHLSYKLSEPVQLALFSHLTDFENHKRSANSRYIGLMLTGNNLDLKYQIRYNVASHFIDEYLMGLSVRERLERNRADRIPNWLKTGFVQYFAQGITYRDFELFRKWSQEGKFRNINFISSREQEVFGSVIWYLFEKEKGRNIDGAFWMLIKNANSFEKSFLYHFDIRFNSWLKNKIDEIQLRNENSIQPDFQFPLPKGNFTDIKLVPNIHSDTPSFYGVISNPMNSHLIRSNIKHRNFDILKTVNSVGFNNQLIFTVPSIEMTITKNKVPSAMIWSNDEWSITNDSHIFYTPSVQNGIWKIIHSNEYDIFLTHQVYNNTAIYSLSKANKKIELIYELQGEKLLGWVQDDYFDSTFYLMSINSAWSQNRIQTSVQKIHRNKAIEPCEIWSSKDNHWIVELSDFIQESESHLSFVKSQETQCEIAHLFRVDDCQFTKSSTQTKGDFYGQIMISRKSKRQAEYYAKDKSVIININFTDEQILDSDTLVSRNYTFDSAQIDTSSKDVKIVYAQGTLFMSDFEKDNSLIVLDLTPKVNLEIYRSTNYRNWFYAKNSSFQLTNRDLDLGYSRNIPTTELYNSPLTLFYSGNYFNNIGSDALEINLFSNFNRRRIGLSATYSITENKWGQDINISYRQRQYSGYNSINQREQSFQISHNLTFKNKKSAILMPFLRSKGQWISDIPLNYRPEISQIEIDRSYLIEMELGISVNSKKWINPTPNVQLNFELSSQNGIFNGRYISGLSLKSESKFKTRHLEFFNRINGKYSFTDVNHLFLIGGTKGWINSNANTNSISNNLDYRYQGLVYNGGYVRGTQLGTRMGNSFISSQTEMHYKPLKLIKSYVLGSSFWKHFTVFGFFDIATGFVGGSTVHYNNPYNTLLFDYPNYLLSAGANRNPWIYSYGYGAQIRLLGTDFRVEFPQSTVGDERSKRSILISLGKNF